MKLVRILFDLLLCIPMLLLVAHFFEKLVDEILKK